MRTYLPRSIIAVGTSLAFLNAISTTQLYAAESGGFFSTVLGVINNAIDSPAWNAQFRKYALPHIKDVNAFTAFLKRNQGRKTMTEDEKIDAVIELGFAENAPQWIDPKIKAKIEKRYPGLLGKHASIDAAPGRMANGIALAAYKPGADCQLSMATATAPASFMEAGMSIGDFAEAMAVIDLIGVPLLVVMTSVIVVAGIDEIAKDIRKMCAEGACHKVDEPRTDGGGSGKCTPDEENRLVAWYKDLCAPDRSCNGNLSRTLNMAINKENLACLNARAHTADVCYGGRYDAGHQQYMDKISNRISKCAGIIGQ